MDLPRIIVVLSSYNGEKYIVRQIESILTQKGVDVLCFVRDDGSTDGTVTCVEQLKKQYHNIILEKGENEGWRRSFMDALSSVGDADFYAFSDQDDIWFEDKLERAVKQLQKFDRNRPVLYHSNRLSCNEHLTPFPKQMERVEKPLDFTNSLVQEYCQGCTSVFNKAAKDLACRAYSYKLPHDYWVALVAYVFGNVVCENAPTMYHIHHGNNASTDGNLLASWNDRLKMYSRESVYLVPSSLLLRNYGELLTVKQKAILNTFNKCKKSFYCRLSLFLNNKVRRVNLAGTFSLKCALLLNKIEIV